MAFLAAALPYLSAAGAAYGAVKQSNADSYNAAAKANEAKISLAQGTAASNQVVRQGRQALGRQAAAFGGAGVGYGGSSEVALDQTAINSEMDALNTRYKGTLTAYGYQTESSLDKSNETSDLVSGGLLAGQQYIKNMPRSYTFGGNATPAQQAGLVPGGP
jgi:hypothetical protein